jgi:hypothetical protein
LRSRSLQDLHATEAAHRELRARAFAAAHLVEQTEALLACAEAIVAAGGAAAAGRDTGCEAAAGGGGGGGGGGSAAGLFGGTALIDLLALVGKGTVQSLRGDLAAAEAQLAPAPHAAAPPPDGSPAAAWGAAAGATVLPKWWPAGAVFLEEALEVNDLSSLLKLCRDTPHAIGILMP